MVFFPLYLEDILPEQPALIHYNKRCGGSTADDCPTKDYRLEMDLPGFKASDLSMNVSQDKVNIRAARRKLSKDGETVKKVQISKTLHLNSSWYDLSKLKANLADGVLVITAPLNEKNAPQEIQITSDEHESPALIDMSKENEEEAKNDDDSDKRSAATKPAEK